MKVRRKSQMHIFAHEENFNEIHSTNIFLPKLKLTKINQILYEKLY